MLNFVLRSAESPGDSRFQIASISSIYICASVTHKKTFETLIPESSQVKENENSLKFDQKAEFRVLNF